MQFWQRVAAFSQGVGPEEAHEDVHAAVRLMRVVAWLVAAAAALSIVNALIILPMNLMADGELGFAYPFFLLMALVGVVWTVAFCIGLLFWVGWTLEAWSTASRGGLTSAFVMAIAGTAWYGIGTLVSLAGLAALVASIGQEGTTVYNVNGSWVGIPVTVALLIVSILLLVAVQRPEVKLHFGLNVET